MDDTEAMSMWSLEVCKLCKGTGDLGTLNGYAIICESCDRSGLMWVERCYLRSCP